MATKKATPAPDPGTGTVTRLSAWPKDVRPQKVDKAKPAEESKPAES